MGLDEVHLQDEGFFVTMDDDEVEMVHVAHHSENLPRLGTQKILRYAVFEVFGFADIDDFVVFVLHQIDAGFVWQKSDKPFKFLSKNHSLLKVQDRCAPTAFIAIRPFERRDKLRMLFGIVQN